ncbi:MAG TPA: SulP family inorganic anion transporter [Streptosporangiaceae bacterium]
MAGTTDPPVHRRLWHIARHDLPSSLVVFLIAIPLSLGIAVATGVPVVAGLIAAVVGGVVGGALGGSVVAVSGPAAGLTVIVAELVQTFGWAATCAITVAAGALQLGLGLFRVARTALAVSPAVVHGMLAGVGIVIALAQVHVVLGGRPHGTALDNLRALPSQLAGHHGPAVATGVLTLAVLIAWPRLPAPLRRVPAALVAVVLTTVAASALGWDLARVDLPDTIAWTPPVLPQGGWPAIATAVVSVALVASVESLLCAVAVDRLHDGPRAALNRELTGQGVANMITGALGGLPIAGVIVRSTTNVASGARTRWSSVLHGSWILLLVLTGAALLERIPMAALAALLVFVGAQMVDIRHLRGLHRHREAAVYLATVAVVVGVGLLEGVLTGVAIAAVIALWRLTRLHVRTEYDGGNALVTCTGAPTFLAVPRLTRLLRAIPPGTHVDLVLDVGFMDHAAVESVRTWQAGHERLGGEVRVSGQGTRWYQSHMTGHTSPAPADFTGAPWPAPAGGAPESPRERLRSGIQTYVTRDAPRLRRVYGRLADAQDPTHLFITCGDSRVVPSLVTGSGPGDLFVVRNIGNLVPPYGTADVSVAAAIDFAVEVLGVRAVTVCGHSRCGAMTALLRGDDLTPALRDWLVYAESSLRRLPGDDLDRLCRTNVHQQLENLMTYPGVRDRVADGTLDLVGMYVDVATGVPELLDASEHRSRTTAS